MRGATPYTVAKRRQVGCSSPKPPLSSACSIWTFCSAYSETGASSPSSVIGTVGSAMRP